jgi:hypothetical protein
MAAPEPRHVRYSARHHARLDAETAAKLEDLATRFHRKQAPILRYVLQWGLSHAAEWTEVNGAMLLHHLGQQHPDRVKDYLDQMCHEENIAEVAAQAYEMLEDEL